MGAMPRQPLGKLAHGGADHPFANRQYQAAAFGDGNELAGRHVAQLRVLPSHQGLSAHDAPGVQGNLRLIDQMELVARQCAAQGVATEQRAL